MRVRLVKAGTVEIKPVVVVKEVPLEIQVKKMVETMVAARAQQREQEALMVYRIGK
jgi:hypothetical protein